ncbi:hypothetical protein NEMIN01_1949 [Nematocida minor]|uniref:uncharacterized protein n=1 Tax=Nematocida minor TaxID=1912983 RepID=UPI00221ECBD4|nr:uncharacterized protein NEMIN01_1949 [Nematocida minor]KAI5192320.1 hypothetical protein NEMIN01_1949 [Nematocida minor]
MKKEVQVIKQLLKDNILLNVVTLEDETTMRELYGLHSANITFNPIYDNTRINIALTHTYDEIFELLKEKENISEVLLRNEYALYSEIKVLANGKKLLPSYDDPSDITPAEEYALRGSISVPATLLKENMKSQGKLPVSRAVRITGKYIDEAG